MSLAVVALALAVGSALGLFGGGGSLLLVPALTYLVGLETKQAVTTSLAVVGIAATVGAIAGFVKGTLPLKPALIGGISTMIGAFGGAIIGARLNDAVQLRIFGAVMAVAAMVLAWQSLVNSASAAAGAVQQRALPIAASGIGVGVLTGLVGVGGGFLIVPALITAGGLEMREAASVSLFVMVLATASALAGYAGSEPVSWSFIMPFAAVTSLGTLAGGIAGRAMSQRVLQQMFAVVLIVVAAFVLMRG
ncbi:MAG: sulfite exporter TauE/SafE family protein [Cyanobacteria bacterium]|nr:sulfite exporter TauE/SafE family protein [Cyanobacteriota bacterium]